MNRKTIYKTKRAEDAMNEIERLENLYLEVFQKKLTVSLFFYCVGEKNSPDYGITVYYENQLSELKFLEEEVSKI